MPRCRRNAASSLGSASSRRRCRGERRRPHGRQRQHRRPARGHCQPGAIVFRGRLSSSERPARSCGATSAERNSRTSPSHRVYSLRSRPARRGEPKRRRTGAEVTFVCAGRGDRGARHYRGRYLASRRASRAGVASNAPPPAGTPHFPSSCCPSPICPAIRAGLPRGRSHRGIDHGLARIRDSFVIARNTAFTYKGKPVDAKAIGKDLGVRYVLEGWCSPAARK